MSTIKVNKIENTSTANGGVAIDVDGHVTIDGQQLPTAGPLSNRNLIINGAMTVNQRGNFTGITDFNYRACDRFRSSFLVLGTWSSEQSTDAPAGFANSLKSTCTTANAAPASNAFAKIDYFIEGQDLQHLDYGSSTAKPLTLSFWVKSNKTGGSSIGIIQQDNSDKLFSTTYSIDSADTWEYKTINISADTAGQIDNDNGSGLFFEFWLNSGSNFTGGSTQDWAAIVNANRNSSNLGVGGAVNDYWQITGVQLEVGSKSTPFEHRSYADELAKCMRYFQIIDGTTAGGALTFGNGCTRAANNTHILIPLGIPLRDKPTLAVTNTIRMTFAGSIVTSSADSPTLGGIAPSVHTDGTNFNVTLNYNGDVGYTTTANTGGIVLMLNTPGAVRLDSEL